MTSSLCFEELPNFHIFVEFPEVLVELALHEFRLKSSLQLPKLDIPSQRDISAYDEAIFILNNHSCILLDLFSRLRLIQKNFDEMDALLSGYLPSPSFNLSLIATADIFSSDTRIQMRPFLNAYLLLELMSSEDVSSEHNCFIDLSVCSILHSTELLQQGRSVFSSQCKLQLNFLLSEPWLEFLKDAFYYKTSSLISGVFSEYFLERLLRYIDCIVKNSWLNAINGEPEKCASLPPELVYETYYAVRKFELFSIMIEYPDSHPALMDLKCCLHHTSLLQDLIDKLCHEVKSRLLHPGVHTDQILLGYGCLVRALRVIDPSSVAQDIICQPVAECLRARNDAVHCIVDRLISPPEDTQQGAQVIGLQRELLLPTPLDVEPTDDSRDFDAHLVAHDPSAIYGSLVQSEQGEGEDGDVDTPVVGQESDWDTWMPDPIEALHQTGLWRRRIDLLSLLVGIYGSKKAFLVEYRNLLSQRLLKLLSFDTDAQLRHLELLKLRFEDTDLQECEVMLKDIRDSRRISNYVAEEIKREKTSSEHDNTGARELVNSSSTSSFPVQAFILSGEYWPEFHREHFKMPKDLLSPFEHFTRCFEKMKGNRSISWMHKLGLVNVDLERDGHKVSMDVSPLQASILHLFSIQSYWTLRDLGQELEVTVSSVRRNLQPFIQLDFLEEVSSCHDEMRQSGSTSPSPPLETYRVCTRDSGLSDLRGRRELDLSMAGEEATRVEMETSPINSSRETVNQELQVFWSYILGMLTNLGGLSLDRIHSTLRMFALGGTDDGADCTRQQLRQFLELKLREGLLICEDDIYKLP